MSGTLLKIGLCSGLAAVGISMFVPPGLLPFGLDSILSAGKQDPMMHFLHVAAMAALGAWLSVMFFGVTAVGGPFGL